VSEENIPQMRETIERLSKDKSDDATTIGNLTKQVAEFKAREVFGGEGYSPSNGNLFVAMNPETEATPEAAVAFAEAQGLTIVGTTQEGSGESGESTTEASDGSENLAGMSGSGSGAGDGGAGGSANDSLTRQQWQELYQTDPEAAKAAAASGRVEISKDNPWTPEIVTAPGVNPYAALATES
jgi:hypothetical protein